MYYKNASALMSNDLLALLSRACQLRTLASYFELTSRSHENHERDVVPRALSFTYDE